VEERIWIVVVVGKWWYYPDICPEGQNETTKNLSRKAQYSVPSQEMGSPEKKSRSFPVPQVASELLKKERNCSLKGGDVIKTQ